MFETNTQTNSALISLSRAAQLTGYHQDYLGQLCRLGKLPAQKVGRNWFTFPEALQKLSSVEVQDEMPLGVTDDVAEDTVAIETFEYSEPQILQNITVSQVEGMPIAIRTVATPTRRMNTVQNILTNIRIESLQQEVSELRQMLARLMSEVAKHSDILQNRSALSNASQQTSDQLKHAYISNFDFNTPFSRINIMQQDQPAPSYGSATLNPALNRQVEPGDTQPRYSLWAVVTATAVVAAFALMTFGMVSGQFFGSPNPQVTTIYSHPIESFAAESLAPDSSSDSVETPLQPTVAGDTLPTAPVEGLR